jgi:hypothetical protein
MKGEVIPFGQIAPDKLLEKTLVGLEAEKDKFELHEIVTKVATGADHADMLICRSFTEPDKIKTISFWSDLDKPLFLPEAPSSILDFIKVSPLKIPDATSDIGQADLSRISFRGEKALVYYAEKPMKSGKVKFALIQQVGKRFEIYELLSGARPKFNMPIQLYSKFDVDRDKARLARLGYKEKQLPQQAK